MDFLWILVAFSLGFIAKQIHLPPLLGYLIAGFGLHAFGVEPIPELKTLTDLGITLLLFTVGLKLDVQKAFKKEILLTTFIHMGLFLTISMCAFIVLGTLGVYYFDVMDLETAAIIGFALSFSSTVISVKVLEEKGEMRSKHGQMVLSVLVLQDIAAVAFLSMTSGDLPSVYAFGLLLLPFTKPLLGAVLKRCGYGEVLALSGFFMAFLGAWLFELVGLKAGLGALAFGVLLSDHVKAVPLSKMLLSFKDIFLIGFFLSIGFYALPTLEMFAIAALITISLPLKGLLFFMLFTKFKFSGRNSFLAASDLNNYSEFGLIVIFMSIEKGLVSDEWIVIMSLATSLSFILSSVINTKTHGFYTKWKDKIKTFEHASVFDSYERPEGANVLVVGMGRVGTGAYEAAIKETDNRVYGVDYDIAKIHYHKEEGRSVIQADVEDADFWEMLPLKDIHYIMLALPSVYDTLETVKLLKLYGYEGKLTSIVKHEDDHLKLLDAGIDTVFNFYAEAGVGLAEETFRKVSKA